MTVSPIEPSHAGGGGPDPAERRKPWSTPVVIVSDLRKAGAQVAIGSDGTDTRDGYQYGS